MHGLGRNAFYVMDRGYVDFARLYVVHQAGAFFVTPAKSNFNAAPDYPEPLRRIRFQDPDSAKTPVFLTHHTALPALTICALDKQRWQVELLFKCIKQHLRIKKSLGTSKNAVKTQLWCAIATDVLIAILKKKLQLDASLDTCRQILSLSVLENTEISCALQTHHSQSNLPNT